MPKIWLPKFDPKREYVVNKPMLSVGDKILFAGDLFDKSLVSARRLKQLYEFRKIALTKEETVSRTDKPTIVKAGPVWRKVMLGEVQIGKSVKSDDEALEIIAAWKLENVKSSGIENSSGDSEGAQRETSDGNIDTGDSDER